ncbi:unnamed protein product [Clonostachys rosea]|uniref:Rhodopsin domain-containing protein n=1 Tax=Bionectria ochroleuca TaxID=29856 RepID=A0ABY6UZS5_BIOOC|nr:unnamed protein product [Clonostachys rosea]
MLEARSSDAGQHIPDRGPQVFAGTLVTLILATVFVTARIICRHFIVRNVSWDDRVIVMAWVFAFFLSFTIMFGANHGLGRLDGNIQSDERGVLRRCEYVFSILYNPALALIKTSVLIFYLRLAKHTQLVLRYSSYFLLVVVNLASFVLTMINIFQCSPISAAWNPFYEGKITCLPLLTEFICASPVNVVTDLALLALPLATLARMRLPIKQKAILIFTFGLAIFVTVIDVVRIHTIQSAISDIPTGETNTTFGGQDDFAWNASLSFMWSAVEVNIGMTCACIPTLKPLILKILPSMLSGPNNSRTTTSKSRNDSDNAANGSLSRPSGENPSPTSANRAGESLNDPVPANDQHASAALEFLTTPEMTHLPQRNPSPRLSAFSRARTDITGSTSLTDEHSVYFGFVNMAKPKSMLKTSASESLKYCSIVAILFLLWGMSYGLLNTLNTVVAAINNFTQPQTLGLTSAYWAGGYLFGPILVGEWILRRDEHNRSRRHSKNEEENVGGFKVTFICGLCFYGIGTIIFWPSAVTHSYGGFMVSNFVVGFGLSILEVAANTFIVLCGPREHGETRLMICQAIQATGSVLSGILANKVFFNNVGDDGYTSSTVLINVQWTYLAITMLCAALGLFFFYMPLPEVSDQELEDSTKRIPVDPKKKTAVGLQLRTAAIILAVLAQWFYVGAQECNSTYFRALILSAIPPHTSNGVTTETTNPVASDRPQGIAVSIPDYLLIGHGAFAVSRILFSYLLYLSATRPRFPKPRKLLSISLVFSFIFALLPVVLKLSNPNLLVIPVILFFFAEGPTWPLIFAIGLRGQGRRTKRAAAFLTMSNSGGGIAPFIIYGIVASGGSVRISYIVIVVLQVLIMAYMLLLECVKDVRTMVDPIPKVPNSTADEEAPSHDVTSNDLHQGEGWDEHQKTLCGKFKGFKLPVPRRKSSSFGGGFLHNEDRVTK